MQDLKPRSQLELPKYHPEKELRNFAANPLECGMNLVREHLEKVEIYL